MLSSSSIFKHSVKSRRFHSIHVNTNYSSQDAHKSVLHAFYSNPSLTFQTEDEFGKSSLYQQLSSLFHTDYQLNPYSEPKLKTLSMQTTLNHLGLASIYKDKIDQNKYLLGIHGTSLLSTPQITPYLTDIKAMETYHNPFHTESGPIWFFYGNNISMALHYSLLNAINTEVIDGASDPHHYPDRVGILGFADKDIIEAINHPAPIHSRHHEASNTIATAQTIAWKQRGYGTPDEHHIGNEIRLPRTYHPQVINLLIFQIKGGIRMFPLDKSTQYVNGKPCKWLKGQGFINTETEVDTAPLAPRR